MKGKAYADYTPQEKMMEEKSDGIESKRRNTSIEENTRIFEGMIEGKSKDIIA